MRALASTGLEPVDLTDAVAAPDQPPRRRPGKKTGVKKAAADKPSARPGDDRKRQAEVAEAEQRLAQAEEQVQQREQAAADARAAADQARRRTAELEAKLESARAAQTEADRARREADAAVKTAARDRDGVKRELSRLQRSRP